MKFVITGASGFVGQPLLQLLIDNDHQIIVLGRSKTALPQESLKSVDFHEWEFGHSVSDTSIFKDSILLHLAWDYLPDFKTDRHLTSNLPGSIELVKSAVDNGAAGILAIGTCFEYGLRSGAIDSSANTNPILPYSIAKDALRRYLQGFDTSETFFVHWARLFYMYGPNQSKKSLMSQLDEAIDRGDRVFRMSRGEQLRDYLHVQDVAANLYFLAMNQESGISNVSSGIPISVGRLVEERIRERQSPIMLEKGYYPYPAYEPMAFWGIPSWASSRTINER